MAGTACGNHRHYTAGCPACQRITRLYWRRRSAMLTDGTWLHKVDINVVRDHIAKLRADGMSIAAIARAANLSENTVYAAATEKRQWVQGGTGYPILAVKPAPSLPANMVPAVGTTRRVRALIADGYSMSHLGRLLDRPVQMVWEWAWAKPDMVHVDTAAAVRDLYHRLPASGPSVRAYNMARRNGWARSSAWDDTTIDDPDAAPDLGEQSATAEGTTAGQDVDMSLVLQVLDRAAPVAALNPAEEITLWRAWEQQRQIRRLDLPALAEFARLHEVSEHIAARIRTATHQHTSTTTTDIAATGRTSERTAA